jgi:hypothetical protein
MSMLHIDHHAPLDRRTALARGAAAIAAAGLFPLAAGWQGWSRSLPYDYVGLSRVFSSMLMSTLMTPPTASNGHAYIIPPARVNQKSPTEPSLKSPTPVSSAILPAM